MADAVERMEWCRERWRWMVRTRRVKEDGTREISSTLQRFFFFLSGQCSWQQRVMRLDGVEMEEAGEGWRVMGGSYQGGARCEERRGRRKGKNWKRRANLSPGGRPWK